MSTRYWIYPKVIMFMTEPLGLTRPRKFGKMK